MTIHYRCDICLATFKTNRPHDAVCPSCGEPVKTEYIEYTDRDGKFTIGGNVTPIDPPSERETNGLSSTGNEQ